MGQVSVGRVQGGGGADLRPSSLQGEAPELPTGQARPGRVSVTGWEAVLVLPKGEQNPSPESRGGGRDARRNGVHGPQPFPRFPFRGLFLFKSLTCASGGQKSTKILPLARGSSECGSAKGSR